MAEAGLSLALRQDAPIPLDVAFGCAPGEMLALVGPSGSGKSTILRSIAGLYRPREAQVGCNGAVWADSDRAVHLPPHRRAVGLVFQSYALFPHMTALGNVVAALGHLPPGDRAERARALLAFVHLGGLEGRRPAELSGGQQQRVAVARALAREPQALLLDEPFSAVDKVTRQKLYRELGDLRRSLAMPIILVTHDFDEAARLADRMCLLRHGRVVQTGTPSDVLARPASVEAARLVDLKNMFEGRILRHEGATTLIDWNGRTVTAERADAFAPGAAVVWALPSTHVILHRPDRRPAASPAPNLVAGRIAELVGLSEHTAIVVAVDGPDGPSLSMTVPTHFARRTGLVAGSPVTVSLLPEGIHIMAAAEEG